jgi:predicted DNA-binding antitoxin AbrB/MazE fold protein
MSFLGHIENGVAKFDEPASLPEGMKVRIVPVTELSRKTLAERFKNIIGAAHDLPEDMAENHDHYLHGTPKR